jgi:hypothetical protein
MNKDSMNTDFVICIKSDDPDLLTPRMIYQVLPDESAARSHYIRVIDNEGEDYLYPEDYFLRVHFPDEIEYTLLHIFSTTGSSSQEATSKVFETVAS